VKIRKTILYFFLFVGGPSLLNGQMTGNPVGVRGEGEWTVSAIGTYMNQQLGYETVVSRRILLKSTWGVTPWLDVYCTGGGVQVDLNSSEANVVDYKGKYRFGYGLGFNLAVKPEFNVWIWAGAQALRFPSEGSFLEYLDVGGESNYREFEMKYDWREFQGHLGVVFPCRFLRFYTAGVVWAIQRLETKREFLEYGSSRSFLGEVQGEYRSGVWTGGVFGVEFLLPQEYSISVECLLFNEENYQVMVGVCQTGFAKW